MLEYLVSSMRELNQEINFYSLSINKRICKKECKWDTKRIRKYKFRTWKS